jgi:lipoprotein-releasing system permease protein
LRYARGRGRGATALPVFGIAAGVLALTVIIAVMNGFQLGFIETILEVSSYHVRIDGFPQDRADAMARIEALPGVQAAVPWREAKGLLRRDADSPSQPQLAVLRALPADALRDAGLAAQLSMESGAFDIDTPDTIVLGAEAAFRAGARVGDTVRFTSFADVLPSTDAGAEQEAAFTLAGIFRTGFYEYDASWAFVNIAALAGGADCTLGIKLTDRWNLDRSVRLVSAVLEEAGLATGLAAVRVSTWRDYNKAFFGALRTEKLMMFVLVGLIFVVVALNIFQAQRRLVLERREEIGLLRSVGAGEFELRCVFAFNGCAQGFAGAACGMVLALPLALNIRAVFTAVEEAVNFVLGFLSALTGAGGGGFSVFSPAVFYLKEVPSRVIPHELALIFLFGFLSAAAAAWFASRKVCQIRPAEAMRYE